MVRSCFSWVSAALLHPGCTTLTTSVLHSTYAYISSWEQMLVFKRVNEKLRFEKITKQSSNMKLLPCKSAKNISRMQTYGFQGKITGLPQSCFIFYFVTARITPRMTDTYLLYNTCRYLYCGCACCKVCSLFMSFWRSFTNNANKLKTLWKGRMGVILILMPNFESILRKGK